MKERVRGYGCSYREDLPMDWTFLLPFGSKLCQEPHSNYCVCFWASAHILVIILLWPPDPSVPVSSWTILLFLQALWCKHIPRTVWCHQHLLCCEYTVYSKICSLRSCCPRCISTKILCMFLPKPSWWSQYLLFLKWKKGNYRNHKFHHVFHSSLYLPHLDSYIYIYIFLSPLFSNILSLCSALSIRGHFTTTWTQDAKWFIII